MEAQRGRVKRTNPGIICWHLIQQTGGEQCCSISRGKGISKCFHFTLSQTVPRHCQQSPSIYNARPGSLSLEGRRRFSISKDGGGHLVHSPFTIRSLQPACPTRGLEAPPQPGCRFLMKQHFLFVDSSATKKQLFRSVGFILG